jgi:DNA polymerase-1
MNKLVIVDVSNLFFRAFYAVPGHFTMQNGTPSNAVYGVISMIFSLIEAEKPTHIIAAQDLKGDTFRHEELDGYKAGRPKMPDELIEQLPYVFGFFEEAMQLPLLSKERYEADDIIACIAEQYRGKEGYEIDILSNDHDLLQLVGDNIFVLQPQNGGKPPKKIDSEAVIKKLGVTPKQVIDYKAIAGDSSDKLAGVPGIGPKGACSILDAYQTLENALEHVDQITGKAGKLLKEYREQALQTKRMVELQCDIELPEYKEENAKIPSSLEPELEEFLHQISSGRLMSWARRLFGTKQTKVSAEQMGMF